MVRPETPSNFHFAQKKAARVEPGNELIKLVAVMSKDVCQALASPTALPGSNPVSEPAIKAFKGHLIRCINAAKWSLENSVLPLMIPEAPACCLSWRLERWTKGRSGRAGKSIDLRQVPWYGTWLRG